MDVEEDGDFAKYSDDSDVHEMEKQPVENDQWNNPVREAQYGRQVEQYSDNPWVMQYFTKYDYNEAHQLVSKHSEIVQEYVRGEYYYKSNNDTVNYEYDAEGRLAKETTVATGAYITYEYDEEGQLVKTVQATPDRFMVNGGNPLLTTTTYSNFAGFNLPQMIVAEGHYSTTYTTVEYDAAGNGDRPALSAAPAAPRRNGDFIIIRDF